MTTIVLPLRSVNFELPELLEEVYEELTAGLRQKAERYINQKLTEIVTEGLGRRGHQRRKHSQGSGSFQCQRCGSRWRQQFTRNGYRLRSYSLVIGNLHIELPRVRCQCGGSVKLNVAGLRPWQRLGEDVTALVQHWSGLAYSLRQMKQELDEVWQSSVGIASLNQRVQPLAEPVRVWQQQRLAEVPPVVMVDAIWVSLLSETGQVKKDQTGRRRRVKKGAKQPIMIALGVWPEQGRYQVLDWELGTGPGEDKDSWLRLLNRLEERGLHPDFGLQLFITDGDQALLAALQDLFWDVPRQRCVFHKIRNVWAKLVLPPEFSEEERRAYRRDFIIQLARIWQPATLKEADKRYHQFCRSWQPAQPDAIATLQRDFQDTLTFYALLQRNRLWPATYLRTTSLLERLNRNIRTRARQAGAYHSLTGLWAMLVQVLDVP